MSNPQLHELLREHGLKATLQRVGALRVIQRPGHHPSAEELHAELMETQPTLSLGTVYKTLDALVEVGLCKRVQTAEGKLRYEGNVHPHHHIHLSDSSEILDYEDAALSELLEHYFAQRGIKGMRIESVQVHIEARRSTEGRIQP